MKYASCILALVALLLGGCGNPNPASAGDNTAKMELRVYQVPPEHTKDLQQALAINFSVGNGSKSSIGSVSSPAPGQLLVLAPASLQDSIASSLKSLSGTTKPTATATLPMQIRLQFWSVDAIAGTGTDDAALASLSGALDEARKALGAVHFELRDHSSSVSDTGESVRKIWFGAPNATGRAIKNSLDYKLSDLSGSMTLNISVDAETPVGTNTISYVNTTMSTHVAIQLGQFLVLSQVPIYVKPTDSKSTASAATRLYIVRMDRVKTS